VIEVVFEFGSSLLLFKKFLQILACRVLALLQKHFLRKKLVQDFGYVAKASCINLSAEFLVLHPNCSFPL
jgi:hypothetical protein